MITLTDSKIPCRIKPIVFDAADVDYLVNHFSEEELRAEIKNSRRQLNSEIDWRWQIFYEDLVSTYKLCLDILKSYRPEFGVSSCKRKIIDVKALKSALDIVEVAEHYTHLVKSGRNFKGICPLHSETSASFYVYPDTQSWHCYGACSTGGDVIALVMKTEHTDFKGALAILGSNRYGT
jgi:hypothetical protein